MRRFFKHSTSAALYKDLNNLAVGEQSIRETSTLDRLLASKILLDEKQAQAEIRDVAERVHGFDIHREYETQYARQGIVIAPLCDAFKIELAEAVGEYNHFTGPIP